MRKWEATPRRAPSRSAPSSARRGGLSAVPPELGAGKLVEWDRALALLDRMPLLRDDDAGEL